MQFPAYCHCEAGADNLAVVGRELPLPRRDVRFRGNADNFRLVAWAGERSNQTVDRYLDLTDHGTDIGTLHHRD